VQVKEVVPFFRVKDMARSIAFYVDGLGFTIEKKWEPEGVLQWCLLRLGPAGLMLEQHQAGQYGNKKGDAVSLCFFIDDAVEYYHALTARDVKAAEPFVGNRLWVTAVTDPDGYRLDFESPTDVREETRLSELA